MSVILAAQFIDKVSISQSAAAREAALDLYMVGAKHFPMLLCQSAKQIALGASNDEHASGNASPLLRLNDE
jgi:hypothetical protein